MVDVTSRKATVHQRFPRQITILPSFLQIRIPDHPQGDFTFSPHNIGFTSHDEFMLSTIGVLGHATVVGCESKQDDLHSVNRTHSLLEACEEGKCSLRNKTHSLEVAPKYIH
jgi:hypothetical protein